MTEHKIALANQLVYNRLVAFWVICEAFAGGIMHGIKLPFTGMIVSSMAVISIILIAWYVPRRSVILKATVIVAICKLMLSPHSPPTAYIAVFFQGVLGEILFSRRRAFMISAILLAVLSLVESAIQRILVLVILYGNDFWYAVNIFIKRLLGHDQISNYSLLLAILYVSIHAVTGCLVGYFGALLAKRSGDWQMSPGLIIEKRGETIKTRARKRKKIKTVFLILWIALVGLFLQSLFQPDKSILPPSVAAGVLFRAFLVVLSWYLVVSPLVMLIIKKVLKKQQEKNKVFFNEIMELLPETKYIFTKSWQMSKTERGIRRLKFFMKIVLLNILAPAGSHNTIPE